MSAQSNKDSFPDAAELNRMAARFAPTDLQMNLAALSAGDRAALAKLVMAGRILDDIFLQQYWSGNEALYEKLRKDTTPLGKARLNYFWINKSPWSNLDGFDAFVRRSLSVSTEIVAHIETLISSGSLEPGTKLPPERELAQVLKVSRASLREAMHELQAKRVIERKPGRGTIVTEPPSHAKSLYDEFGNGGGTVHWEIVLAGSVLMTLPVVIVFFAMQRHFVRGIATTGLKG